MVFHYFHYPTHAPKCSQNRFQIDLKSIPKPPSWAPSRHLSANMGQLGPLLLQLGALLSDLGPLLATTFWETEKSSTKFRLRSPKSSQSRSKTLQATIFHDFRPIQTSIFMDLKAFGTNNHPTQTRLHVYNQTKKNPNFKPILLIWKPSKPTITRPEQGLISAIRLTNK